MSKAKLLVVVWAVVAGAAAVASWLLWPSPESRHTGALVSVSAGDARGGPNPTTTSLQQRGRATAGSTSDLEGVGAHEADAQQHVPAGERLRPGAAPTQGTPFEARTRSGAIAHGELFRAAAKRAPLIVFLGEDPLHTNAWRSTLATLRSSRDYHLVVARPPATQAEGAGSVEAARGVEHLEAALTWAERALRGGVDGKALVGAGLGAAAAALLAAERRDVLALVAVSPPPRLGAFRLKTAFPQLKGRPTRWFGAADDERSSAMLALARALPLASVTVRPGALRGTALLQGDRRVRTSLAGWLFAVMPEAE